MDNLSFFLGMMSGAIIVGANIVISDIKERRELIKWIVKIGKMTKDADTLVIFALDHEQISFILAKDYTEIRYDRYNGTHLIINPKSKFGKKLLNICLERVMKEKFPELRF